MTTQITTPNWCRCITAYDATRAHHTFIVDSPAPCWSTTRLHRGRRACSRAARGQAKCAGHDSVQWRASAEFRRGAGYSAARVAAFVALYALWHVDCAGAGSGKAVSGEAHLVSLRDVHEGVARRR